MDELGRALLQFFYEGARWMEELLAEEAARWQISAAEAKILLFLFSAPGMDTAKDVAQYCGVSKASVSGNVLKIRQATVTKESAGIGWGAVYAEFEEDMDKVSAQGNALKVERTIYKDGKPLAEGDALMVGDKLEIRLTVVADRDMDFVQVKDERAACMEPVDALSGYRWNNRIGYYQETKDASTAFCIDRMRKGAYEFSYEVYVTSSGVYQQGIATACSVYAPEFGGHSSSSALVIQDTAL